MKLQERQPYLIKDFEVNPIMPLQLMKREEGGIALEAALLLPLFLAFVVSLIMFIQISMAEMALQSAVSETTKSISTQIYPVKLLVQEAKSKYDQSDIAKTIQSVLNHIQTARSKVIGAEEFVDDYAFFIPDAFKEMLTFEKKKRELFEAAAQSEYEGLIEREIMPQVYAAFTTIVYAYSDSPFIHRDKLKVTSVILPNLLANGSSYFGVEAQLEFKLIAPFFSRTLILKKKAYERTWLGA
ncbi:TadE/TadG family type IV pilus assembly protein [Paenibacillus eucommiae]|uniref:Pilus assembly protein n=1 Tax=Paenibacillus eucommiae TaxID=1355755 RepID=A0ABS4J7M7_9BACL|nr:TadE/TadG family type IV pilus assembly protein [Paenibacillus eucommiae]MBP1995245.1 hypothetical protein [Paenibacillus eucommiae]